MIIQNISAGQGSLSVRSVGNDAPAVVNDSPAVANNPPVVATQPVQATAQPPTAAQLKSAVDSINRALQQSNQSLEFSVDPTTKTSIVKMMDKETGKVISQYPSEQVLAIAQSIDDFLNVHQLQQGLLLQQKA
jgi:flagellar protein FlaG